MKEFNTTAVFIPERHYMVDLTERVKEIRKIVDAGKYFTINRARQYGKTTIDALSKSLAAEYVVVSLSFEGIGEAGFKNEHAFVKAFCQMKSLKAMCSTERESGKENLCRGWKAECLSDPRALYRYISSGLWTA